MVTQWIFLALVAVLGAQRLMELRLSARNERVLREQGAIEMGEGLMPWMRLLHGTWLVAMVAEVFYFDRPFVPVVAAFAVLAVLGGQALRYAAIHRLGNRWTVKVIVVPDAPPVTGGIYRYVRHPNYVGVILEIAFMPLIHTAWLTAVIFTVLNAVILRSRIRTEEAALKSISDYDGAFGDTPRFVPSLRGEDDPAVTRDEPRGGGPSID